MPKHKKKQIHKHGRRGKMKKMSLRATRSNPYSVYIFAIAWIALSAFGLLAMTAHAAEEKVKEKKEDAAKTEDKKPEEKENPARYAPDFCDFEITFPEKPTLTQKCIPDGDCYQMQVYTMVYGMASSIDVSANCTPSTAQNYERYTQPVMKAALAGMVDDKNLDDYDINFSQEEGFRNAAVSGTGTKGASGKIYTGQIWVGKNSVFTVQAELVGDSAFKQADDQFSNILKSIQYKGGKQLPEAPKATSTPKGNNQ